MRQVGLIAQVARMFTDRRDTYGPPVIERGYERRTCPTCGAVAVRPVDMPRDIHTYPPGHEVLFRCGRLMVDRCPGAVEDSS